MNESELDKWLPGCVPCHLAKIRMEYSYSVNFPTASEKIVFI